jgi:Cdc6-like AAA superfamily ATPase
MNQASSDLPAGLDAQNYLVHLITTIYDMNLCFTTSTTDVTVAVNNSIDVNQYLDNEIKSSLANSSLKE